MPKARICFDQFIDCLHEKYDVEIKWGIPMIDPLGQIVEARFFVRQRRQLLIARVPDHEMYEEMPTEEIVQICRALDIPPHTAFGIFAG